MNHLAAVSRGVEDLERSVEFYSWLLGLEPHAVAGTARFTCRNGEFTLVTDAPPVYITWAFPRGDFAGVDPDLVPVAASDVVAGEDAASVALDHVRLNCADLAASVAFYRGLELVLTWAGSGSRELPLVEDEPGLPAGADWVHLSSGDGYLSLSQADWLDYGVAQSRFGPTTIHPCRPRRGQARTRSLAAERPRRPAQLRIRSPRAPGLPERLRRRPGPRLQRRALRVRAGSRAIGSRSPVMAALYTSSAANIPRSRSDVRSRRKASVSRNVAAVALSNPSACSMTRPRSHSSTSPRTRALRI